jgi:hypothetical protein
MMKDDDEVDIDSAFPAISYASSRLILSHQLFFPPFRTLLSSTMKNPPRARS